jgi:hypothetical protein
MESRIRRLEIAIVVLSLMVVLLVGLSVYGVHKIVKLTDKIPDYENVEKYVDKAGNVINYFKKEEK